MTCVEEETVNKTKKNISGFQLGIMKRISEMCKNYKVRES